MKMMLIAGLLITLPAVVVIAYGLVSNQFMIWPAVFSLFNGGLPFLVGAWWLRKSRSEGDAHEMGGH